MSDYIVCYDITDPRRLGRIHRAMKKQALPLQRSVFLLQGSELSLRRCLDELELLMDPHDDDIRAYPLPQRGLRLVLGPSALPEGVHWPALDQAWDHPAVSLLPADHADTESQA